MIVQPDFLDHWKTKLLQRKLGDTAPLVLLRLWGYCQIQRQWTFDLPPEALGVLCDWEGDPDELAAALITARFIKVDGDQVTVLNWDEHNAGIIKNWKNGKRGGRPKKPAQSDNPTETQENPRDTLGKPSENPKETQSNPRQTQCKPNKNKNKNKSISRKENPPAEGKRKSATAARAGSFSEAWKSEEAADIRKAAEEAGCSEDLLESVLRFEEMRAEGKHPLTSHAVKLMLADLRKCRPAVAKALLDDAVKNGSRGWYWPEKAQRFEAEMRANKNSPPPARRWVEDENVDPRARGLIYQS